MCDERAELDLAIDAMIAPSVRFARPVTKTAALVFRLRSHAGRTTLSMPVLVSGRLAKVAALKLECSIAVLTKLPTTRNLASGVGLHCDFTTSADD